MTRSEAAANLLQYLKENENPGSVWAKSLDMAISALREQEERSKGCGICCEDKDGTAMLGAFYITNPFHGSKYYLNTGHCKPREIKFCPMCGRRLEEV